MNAIKTALREVYGLFVEDGSYALALVVWIVAVALLLPRLPIAAAWRAPILFAGMILILLENVVRSARK